MQRVWINKSYSSVHAALMLIRQADVAQDYHLVYSHTQARALPLYAAHEAHLEPSSLAGVAYLDWCLHFCRQHSIHIFWPHKEAALIAANSDRFIAQGTRVLNIASEAVLHLLHDKAKFYEASRDLLLPPAEFTTINNVEQFDIAYQDLRSRHEKLCFKPAISVYGLGFAQIDEKRSSAQILMDGEQYQIGLHDLRRGLAEQGSFKTMLLMEFLAGNEYSVDTLADHGRLVCAVPRRKSLKQGHGQRIDLRSDILQAVQQLIERHQLNGLFNAQFRQGKNGLALLEINARMSGGVGMACMAGPNLPYLALRGFDVGYEHLPIPAVEDQLRVSEFSTPVALRNPLASEQA